MKGINNILDFKRKIIVREIVVFIDIAAAIIKLLVI